MSILKRVIRNLRIFNPITDIVMVPITLIGGLWFRLSKFLELKKLPLTKSILLKLGVFPIVDHYYEPKFNFSKHIFSEKARHLPGINFNVNFQLEFLNKLNFQDELSSLPWDEASELKYYYNNSSFPCGDSELYYSIIRLLRPKKIVEVGSGYSTRMALEACRKNEKDYNFRAEISCIEPFEMPWLEQMDITVIRSLVEDVDSKMFKSLNENDILFIDSSHVLRPGGDVLFEILEILPQLKKGTYVHFHDIFTPFEYPESWLVDEGRLWNEQYLLEAFISNNSTFEIVSAMAYLNHYHRDNLNRAFPILSTQPDRMPGSLWIKKVV